MFPKTFLPTLAILGACVIWGLNGIFVNTLDLPTSQQAFFRLSVPFVVTGVMLLFQWKKGNSKMNFHSLDFLLISGANALRIYLLSLGFILTTVGNAVIAQRSNTILILILAYFFLQEKITLQKIVSLSIGFIGLIVIAAEKGISLENDNFLGVLSIMGAAAISSFLNIQYKQKIHTLGSTQTIFLQSFLGTIVFGVFAWGKYPFPSGDKLILAFTHSFLIGVVGFYLFFWGLKKMEVGKASLLTYSEVIFGVIFGYVLLSQIPTHTTYIGMACILASGIILSLKKKTSKIHPSSPD